MNLQNRNTQPESPSLPVDPRAFGLTKAAYTVSETSQSPEHRAHVALCGGETGPSAAGQIRPKDFVLRHRSRGVPQNAKGATLVTALGSLRADATGRSTGRRKTNRFTRLAEQFAARPVRMIRSAAFRELSLSARRLLDRLEFEFADHGGTNNGKLPVTYDDFKAYGIHRHSVAPAIREAVALGFVEVTEPGRAGNAEYRKPNLFRLTYRNIDNGPPTHEWERIETDEQAAATAKSARAAKK